MQEPKDGDFVAYVEALQRESAARLARTHASPGDTPFALTASRPGPESASAATPGATAPAEPTHVSGRRKHDAKLVRAIFAGGIGLLFLLSWMGDGGPFAFIAGVALLGYALPRVLSALGAPGEPLSNKGMVDHVFGRSGTSSRGSRK